MHVANFQEINITRNHPDLSIVMPVYNAIDTIYRSVNSFLGLAEKLLNNYDINCSLYIVDDFSTDRTTQAADDLSQSHNNIFFIKNDQNIGPGLSRNKALELIEDGYEVHLAASGNM